MTKTGLKNLQAILEWLSGESVGPVIAGLNLTGNPTDAENFSNAIDRH